MQDKITKLCNELVEAEDPEDLYPVSEQLQEAIHARFERVRESAMGVVLIDRVVNLDAVISAQGQGNKNSSRQHSG